MLFIFISSSFLKLVLSVTLIVHTASQSCSSSSDCTNPSTPGCLGTTCGYCTLNTQCLSLSESRCLSGSCTSCGSDRDCNDKFPSNPYCGPSSTCVNCLSSSQCTYDKPRCTSNTCSACQGSATDCQGRFSVRTLCSGTTGKCVQCNSYTDCATADAARCGSDGLCAGCTLDTECGARFNGKSRCKSSAGVCVECLSNSDCTSSSGSRCENNVCTAETISKALQDVQGLIQGSNLAKILNYEALYGFDLLRSPLFYIVFGFTLVMLAISIWAALKDKALDRDLLKLPEKAPSRIYKLIVYILITHTFFCIFVLFEKNSPRVMRSALFYTKIMGLMAVSTIFNQNNQELSSIQRTVLAILTILVTTPINMFASYVAFKRHLQPKIRRKRKERGGRGRVAYVEDISKKNSNFKKSIDTILIILGYISLIIIILGYVYTIFVITANNITANNQIVRKWLNGFLQSIALELFGIQIGKVFLHLGILSALQKSTRKKFLCIPRKYLPKMLNPTIFDFQKRFAVLEQLYKKPKPGSHVSLPLPELEFGDEASSPAPSVNHNGQTSIAMMMGAGFALNDNTSPGTGLSVRKKEMLRMRTKMKLPININHEPIEETNKEYVKNERISEELSPRRGKSPVSIQKHKDEVLAKTQRSAKRLRGVTFIKKAAGQEVNEGQKDELQLP